jgi:hypothetical protein
VLKVKVKGTVLKVKVKVKVLKVNLKVTLLKGLRLRLRFQRGL